MSLIEKIFEATRSGALTEPFTVEQMKVWMVREAIHKDNGDEYTQSSIDAILANSDVKNKPTTNRNRKVLKSSLNQEGKKYYWF